MRKECFNFKYDATITIFLTLILLIILSLIFTIIEGARISTAKVFAQRALSASMDSVLAEYYRPLWEEYHIFAYHSGEGSSVDRAVRLEEKLSEYMTYTLSPRRQLEEGIADEALELYDITLEDVTVDNQTKLMDYQGELFINEAVEYMKYDKIADGVELLLDKLSLLETPKKVSIVYDKKLAAEEELAAIDIGVLQLMELLDGIKTSKKGIELDREGRLQTKKYFVKMLCNAPITPETVNINHDAVFQAIKEHFVNPVDKINTMKSMILSLEQVEYRLKQLGEAQRNNSENIRRAQEVLWELEAGNKKSKELQQQIREINEQIYRLIETGNEISSDIADQNTLKESLNSDLKSSMEEFLEILKELIPLVQEAIRVIENIGVTANQAKDKIDSFEESLELEQKDLSGEILKELEDALNKMKNYTSDGEAENSYSAMKKSLEYNIRLLMNAEGYLLEGLTYLSRENYREVESVLTVCCNELSHYEINNLKLDYSSLVLDHARQKNPLSEISSLLEQGLLELVIDPKNISKKELPQNQLPSTEEAMQDGDVWSFKDVITDFIKNCSAKEGYSSISNFFSYGDSSDIFNLLGKGLNKITEQLLFREYIKEYFKPYQEKQEGEEGKKPSALEYEQEYLLIGKVRDQENFASVVSRIIFLRSIANFVSILTDKAKCTEALSVATALVGFTGLPVLISITKTLLLVVWAFAEALIDTCALLSGMEVPMIKKNIIISLPELFLLNRSYLQSKISQIEKAKLNISYQDYLRLFLLFKNSKELSYRSMDLIQENINLRYEEDFKISNCLYGFETEAQFHINTKFLAIPMIQKSISFENTYFIVNTRWEYSY